MFCYNCGKQLSNDASFCPYCGIKQKGTAAACNPPSNAATTVVEQPAKKFNKLFIILPAIATTLILLIVIICSCRSNSGAKCKVYVGDISFSVFNETDSYSDEVYNNSGYLYLYDDDGCRMGEVDWDCEYYSSSKEAKEDLNEVIAFYGAFGADIESFRKNGILMTLLSDGSSDDYTLVFCVDSCLYNIDTYDLPEDAVMKIASSVKK